MKRERNKIIRAITTQGPKLIILCFFTCLFISGASSFRITGKAYAQELKSTNRVLSLISSQKGLPGDTFVKDDMREVIDENKDTSPQDHLILFTEVSIWKKYRWYFIVLMLVISVNVAIIVYLIVTRKGSVKKEKQLQQREGQYRAYVETSREGIWCVEFEKPINLDLPEDEQFELVYQHGYISFANDAYAKIVGLENGSELVGAKFTQFVPRNNAINVATIKAWIKQRYSIVGVESVETFREGITRNMLNTTTAIIKDGYVDQVWGTSIDITDLRQSEKALIQSKDFNKAILNSIEDQICVLDREGIILTVNNSWLLFARDNGADTSTVWEGVNYLDQCRTFTEGHGMAITDKKSADEAIKGIFAVLQGDSEGFTMEYPCHSPMKERWFQMVVLPFKGEKGGLVVAHRDITERKTLELNLADAELHYRTIADYTYDWEYWEAPDGSLKYASPSCERITEYSVDEFIEHPELIEEIIIPEDRKIWHDHAHGVPIREETTSTQFRILTKNGLLKWIAHVCQPVYNEQGEYQGVRANNRDITILRETERTIHQQSDLLQQFERRENLGQLTGSIGHELNQPLTGILSDAQAGELLLEQRDPDLAQIKSIFTDIVSDTKRASQILRNLRQLFAGDLNSNYDTINVNILILDTLKLLNSEFLSRGVSCRTELTEELPDVEGNNVQLQQVLINLVRNSWQALDLSEKIVPCVTISTIMLNDNHVAISVIDNGPGVDPDQTGNIFKPLVSTKNEGMGMGLAISNSIVNAHGGRLWLENTSNGGTEFIFSLPERH